MENLIFLKLGGSLITDKTTAETPRMAVLVQAAAAIATAVALTPHTRLLIGHGSGSFGHTLAAQYQTRRGVQTAEEWQGFTAVSEIAIRLNRLVLHSLRNAGLPAISFSPSASALCHDGKLQQLSLAPIQAALAHGLIPLVHGDVAFDTVRGGTIVSTEEIFAHLVSHITPQWLLLAGETDGVYDAEGKTIPRITPTNLAEIRPLLGGSQGTDVTGGMLSKVEEMLRLTAVYPTLRIRIFSGLTPGNLTRLITNPHTPIGTLITQ
jgi:isopentenyl phosphate kinase